MNWLDIIISLILITAFVKGFRKGFALQLAGLVAVILAAILAGRIANILLPYLLSLFTYSEKTVGVISYILAFLAIILFVRVVGKLVHNLFEILHLSFINQLMGAIVNVGCFAVVLSVLLNLTIILDYDEEIISSEIKRSSFFYPRIQIVVPTIVPYLREELWDQYIKDKEDDEQKETKEKRRLYLLSAISAH